MHFNVSPCPVHHAIPTSVVKNGKTRHGRQNHKCLDCGRQFVENPNWTRVSERTLSTQEVIDQMLLEKIPLAGIARVAPVSETWLQNGSQSERQQK